MAQNEKLKKEVSRLKKTAAEKAEWSRSREGDKTKKQVGFIDTESRRVNKGAVGADAARTMKRSKAIVNRMETQISEKEKLLKDIEYIDSLTMNSQASHHKRLLSVEDLQLGMKICYSSQFILQSSLISGWRFQVLTVQESHPLSIIFWGHSTARL